MKYYVFLINIALGQFIGKLASDKLGSNELEATMNYEFINRLDQAKTLENASQLEALKRMYIICEIGTDPQMSNAGAAKFCDMASGVEYNGEQVDDHCYVFSCPNGTVRLTLISDNSVMIEVSPTGNSNLYRSIGTVGIDTGLSEALSIGTKALGNDELTKSWYEDLVNIEPVETAEVQPDMQIDEKENV